MAKNSGNGKGFKGGVSPAQSGGINHTFGGGKGGTALSRGTTAGRKIGGGRNNAGLEYAVRSEGGDKTLKSKTFHVGMPPPITTDGAEVKTKKISVRKPGRAGSV